MATVALTLENFEQTISTNDLVIIDFWAEWCGPCKTFGPIFEKVSEKYPDVVFGKVETDQQQELSSGFQIRSIPTLMIFREKIIIFTQPGMLPESNFVELVEKALSLDMDMVRAEIAKQGENKEA